MEGNTEQLSSSSWFDLFLQRIEEDEDLSSLDRLYPRLEDDYLERHPEVQLEKNRNQKPSVLPYIRRRDLNNDSEAPLENKPVPAWEIGIKVDF